MASESEQEDKALATTMDEATFNPLTEPRIYIIATTKCATVIAFNGLSSLMSLLLLEPRLGIAKPTMTVEEEGQAVALWVMSFVPVLGIFQLIIVLNLFPRAVDKLGLTSTGAIGCSIVAVGMALMVSHIVLC